MSNQRKQAKTIRVRFKPADDTLALIQRKSPKTKKTMVIPCLILNESFSGCALVSLASEEFKKDEFIRVKVGNLALMQAQIRWVKAINADIITMGLEYLE